MRTVLVIPLTLWRVHYLESLTTQVEEKSRHWYERVENMGGAKAAIDSGYYLKEMAKGQYQNQKEIESGERKVVGVNTFCSG
jgi:methylmalonyl-CoA mutase N-terminal domain/subunit